MIKQNTDQRKFNDSERILRKCTILFILAMNGLKGTGTGDCKN